MAPAAMLSGGISARRATESAAARELRDERCHGIVEGSCRQLQKARSDDPSRSFLVLENIGIVYLITIHRMVWEAVCCRF